MRNGPDINVKDILKTTALLWRAQDTHRKVSMRPPVADIRCLGTFDITGGDQMLLQVDSQKVGVGEVGTQAETRDKKTRGCKDTQCQMGKIKKADEDKRREGKEKGWGTEGQTEEFGFEVISVWSLRQQQDGRKGDTRE